MKNQVTGEYGPVPDTARQYKVTIGKYLFMKATYLKCITVRNLHMKSYETQNQSVI